MAWPNAGVRRLRQKKTAWATPWPKPPAAQTFSNRSEWAEGIIVCAILELLKRKQKNNAATDQ